MAVDDFSVDLPEGPPRNISTLVPNHLDLVSVPNPYRLADALTHREQVLSLQRVDGIAFPLHAVGPLRLLRRQSPQRGGWVRFGSHNLCECGCKLHQILSPGPSRSPRPVPQEMQEGQERPRGWRGQLSKRHFLKPRQQESDELARCVHEWLAFEQVQRGGGICEMEKFSHS
jgi:hypothetical protein